VDTAAKILTEASIFRRFDAHLLPTPVLDFLTEAIKILDSREVTMSFCMWLVVHGVEKGEEEHEGTRHPGDVGSGDVWSRRCLVVWLLMCCCLEEDPAVTTAETDVLCNVRLDQ